MSAVVISLPFVIYLDENLIYELLMVYENFNKISADMLTQKALEVLLLFVLYVAK
jgi:hypothetical protein